MFDSANYTTAQGNNGTSTATVQSSTTAKQTSRGIRVWLENKQKLESAGFYAGAHYTVTYMPGYAVLTIGQFAPTNGTVSSCKRNGVVRPIIDLHSKAVAQAFNAGEPLTVVYTPGKIEIVVDMLTLAQGE
jgi:hypothetical protein